MKKTSLAALGAGALGGYALSRLLTSGRIDLPASSTGKHIVILGAGFGGLAAASKLSSFADQLRISVIDQHNYHLFTPMLYQAATCGIVPSDAAIPVRRWSGHKRLRFRQGIVRKIDLDANTVHLSDSDLRYDFLVLALGSTTNFFGNDSARRNALPLKTLEEGVLVRNHVIDTLEAAAATSDAQQRRDLLTHVVVGGGATGVETAGALAGLLKEVLRTDYPVLRGEQWRVILLDAAPKLLGHMGDEMASIALRELTAAGVTVRLNTRANEVGADHVITASGEKISTRTVIWATGVRAAEVVTSVAANHGHHGSILVDDYLQIQGRTDAYAIGDNAEFVDPGTKKPVPLLAAAAMQQGEATAENIVRQLRGQSQKPFHYRNLGNVVSVGTRSGVAQFGGKVISGFAGWLAWRAVHLARITNMRNQLATALDWTMGYFYDVDTARLDLEPTKAA